MINISLILLSIFVYIIFIGTIANILNLDFIIIAIIIFNYVNATIKNNE